MRFPARQRVIVAAIRQAREQAGYSQRALARELGEVINYIQRIEAMQRDVSVAELMAIEKALKLPHGDLYMRAGR